MDEYTKNALRDYWRRGDDELNYKEYKDDWIYEWNKGIPWVNENPWTDDEAWSEPIDNINHECKPLRFKNRIAK
ncbi:hypothetical protein Tco_0411067 [Tanacetum coccineum]